jgi:hypothetical protein
MKKPERRHGGYQFATQQTPHRKCVYCNSESHKSAEWDTVLTFEDRKKFLAENHLYFNSTGPLSTSNCQLCKTRHHTSICDTLKVDDVSKVDKPELMKLNNPNYTNILESYSHLNGVKFDDPHKCAQIPIHLVVGASNYAKMKTAISQKVGCPGEPVAEKTLLGLTVMSPGKEGNGPILLTQSTTMDYEQLCALDVLGLPDTSENDQQTVYQEFKEQLQKNEAGWYETRLP